MRQLWEVIDARIFQNPRLWWLTSGALLMSAVACLITGPEYLGRDTFLERNYGVWVILTGLVLAGQALADARRKRRRLRAEREGPDIERIRD